MIKAPIKEGIKWVYPGKSKLKIFCRNGTEMVRKSIAIAKIEIIKTAIFFSKITEIKLLDFEREVMIKNILPIIKAENATTLISPFVCPSLRDMK